MKKLLSAIAVAATFLIGSMSGAMAACTGPAVMHDFANTAFNMSLITAQDGNCASNVGLNTSTAGALVAGVAVDGWNVTLGAKADAAWVSGSGSVVAILKNIAAGVAGSVPVTVNGTPTALTGLTPAVAQTGTIVAANMDLTSVGGTAIGAMANFGTTPGAVKVQGVNASLFMGTAAISATNGSYSNLLQGNAVISATNGIYANVLQGNAALSVTNPSFSAVTDGSHGAANTKAASTPAAATDIALVVDQRPGTANGAAGQGATGSAAPSGATQQGVLTGDGTTGGHLKAPITCDNYVFKHITSATDTLAVQGVASQTIYVCGFHARAAGTATWYLENTASANANCSSANTQLTILASEVANSGMVDHTPFWSGLKNTVANGLCINSTGTGGVDVGIYYTQF